MIDQAVFDFETQTTPSAPHPPAAYPLPLAFSLLSMMAGEAVYYLEQINQLAASRGDQEIAINATRALRALTDEPTSALVGAAAMHSRARIISEDCSYG